MLDAVATRGWNLLDERPHAIDELVFTIVSKDDLKAERCRGDTFAFVRALADAGVVDVGSAEST
jgi:Coenzyme PQQ synthesis protein D (PqqD)